MRGAMIAIVVAGLALGLVQLAGSQDKVPGPATLEGSAVAAGHRDWGGHTVVFDQLSGGTHSYGAHSTIDNDTPLTSTTADDFQVTGGDWYISDIHLAGWSYWGDTYLAGFRVQFWSDVPATINDASKPGTSLATIDVLTQASQPNDEVGWYANGDGTYNINLAQPDWFLAQAGVIYWISVQGIMVDDGYGDTFYWNFKTYTLPHWQDDSAFESAYFTMPPWYNWGVADPCDPNFTPDLYDGPFEWSQSLDMAFALTAVEVPVELQSLTLE